MGKVRECASLTRTSVFRRPFREYDLFHAGPKIYNCQHRYDAIFRMWYTTPQVDLNMIVVVTWASQSTFHAGS